MSLSVFAQSSAQTPTQLEILTAAVRIARDRQIRTVACLRDDLLEIYPESQGDIDAALMLWARHEAAKRLH